MKLRVVAILVVALAQIAAAERYRVIDLGPLQPVGINASGELRPITTTMPISGQLGAASSTWA